MARPKLPLNQILQGDCIEVMRSLPEKSVDMIFADPPYNLQLQQELLRPDRSVVNGVDDEWDRFSNFFEYDCFTRNWLGECRRLLKDDGTLWVIGTYHNIYRVGHILMDLGYWILNDVIWHKINPMPNFRGTRFTNATETLLWVKKSAGQRKYTFNYHAMKNLNEEKQMQNVWYIPLCTGAERLKIDGRKAHSTQKPEALLYRVILAASNPGHIVLDPFFGSGTTGAVAKKLKRNFVGIESNTEYIEIAQDRLDRIPAANADPETLSTRSKRDLPRVSFGQLLEGQYLKVGQKIYSQSRDCVATVKADSQLTWGKLTGSIHKIAAQTQGKSAHNGWEFWYYEDEAGQLVSIDRLREKYRQENNLA